MAITPPDPSGAVPGDILAALRLGLHFRGLDETHARALLRVLPQSIADFLEDRLETDALRAMLAVRGIRYSSMGPQLGGHHPGVPRRLGRQRRRRSRARRSTPGVARVPWPRHSHRRRAGPAREIRTGAEVVGRPDRGRPRDGRHARLGRGAGRAGAWSAGSTRARRCSTWSTPRCSGPRLGWQAGNLRQSGVTAKVDLALAGLPVFTGLDGDDGATRLRGRLVVAPSVRYLDVAHDAAKYGRMSDQPWLEATIPSLADPLLVDGAAASGVRHVMSILVQSAPRDLRDGDWDDRSRDAAGPDDGGPGVGRAGHRPAGRRTPGAHARRTWSATWA